ncbi:T9SS type A sorting domain-containing protein [Fulvivirga sp. 29W222]|uniref:T9SS type A sorting domain-containing protein n=1 Tax=Fulvivirga marina TaxID=2494733 RepID=A0A937KF12_9BACT|nr:GEVED domain-containing protein [Fulvivirga marina]MBL6447723.1 T9SS type A sorting domain-containing protein [Fulvivirga marina]
MKNRPTRRALRGRVLSVSMCLLVIALISVYYSGGQKNDQVSYYEKIAGLSPEELKNTPKYDRPDLALLHEFEMTKDPSLGFVPSERKVAAFKEVKSLIRKRATQKAIDNVNWTERGPNNVGGRTRALMFDPNDTNAQKVWAGGVAGGLWYNNNITSSSSQWVAVDNFWANLAISTIAYDPSNTQNFYVGTGEGFYNADAVRGAGIWKTADGGSTWSQLSSTNNSNFYYVQKVAVTSSGTVLAATRAGLYRSTDGGASWSQVIAGKMADIEVTSNGNIFVSKGIFDTGVVYKSTNDGVSFSTVTPASGGERIELASAPSNGNVIYAVASSGSDIAWFRKSTDGGSTWTSVTTPNYLSQSCTNSGQDFTRGQAWYDLILAVHPTNSNIVLVGGVDIHKSTNGGNSWSSVSYWTGACASYLHADQHAIAFRPGFVDQAIFGNDGGVSYSSNVGSSSSPSFSARNNGYNVTQFYAVAASNTANSNYFLAGAQDNGSHKFTSAGINSTTEVSGGDGAFCHIDQDNSNYQITSYVYNVYYRSTNGGSSFSNFISDQGRGRFINPTDYDDSANKLYAAGNANELVRIDNITGSASKAVVNVSINSGKISAVKVSPFTANRIFVATENGDVYRIDNAHTSSPTVTSIRGASFPNGYVSCIEIGSSDSQLLVTFSSYGVASVWESRNGGSSWANKEGNLPDMPVRWVLYNPSNTNQVLLATELGVWSVDDINVTSPVWDVSNAGLANVRCDMLQYRAADKLVVLATHGRGVFTTDVFSSTIPPPTCTTTISSFPYAESFESGLGSWTQDTGDDIDWTRQSGSTPSSSTGPTAATDDSYYMFVESSSPNYPGKVSNLVSPCFNLASLSNPELKFAYHMYGAAMGTLNVQASTDNGATWTTVWTKSGDQGNAWADATVDLSAYSGTIKLRFSGTTGSNYTGDMSVDKISVASGGTSSCAAVSSFPYNESFEIGLGSWTQDSSDDIDWTRQSGSTPSSSTGPTAATDGSYYMFVESSSPNYPSKVANLISPCFDITVLSNPTLEFSYHMYGAAMGVLNVQVSTNNGSSWSTAWTRSGDQGNSWSTASVDLSAYSGTIKVRFNGTTGSNYTGDMSVDKISLKEGVTSVTYCAAQGNSVTDEWIQRVRLGSIDNNSGSNSGYADFTSISTDLAKGSSYTITINPAWSGTVYSEAYAVWIDYNKDGDFTDSGEQVYSAAASTNTLVSGNFTVSSSALSGSTRMRVIMRYNTAPSSCESFDYGEVEDYAVNITSSGAMMEAANTPEMSSVGEHQIKAYPNPLKERLNVDLHGFEGAVNVRLLNSAGKEVMVTQTTSGTTVFMDVSQLKAGIYVLVAEDNDKVLKQLVFKD